MTAQAKPPRKSKATKKNKGSSGEKEKPPVIAHVKLPPYLLTEEPWIEVVFVGEAEPRRVSLKEFFAKSREIAWLAHPSASVQIGESRLLACISQRLLTPKTAEEWLALFRDGVDARSADDYFAKNESKFDLFGRVHPFFQVNPDLTKDETSDICLPPKGKKKATGFANPQSSAKLTLTHSAGSIAAHFNKSFDDDPPRMTPAEAAAYSVAFQSCAIGGSDGGAIDSKYASKYAKREGGRATIHFPYATGSSGGTTCCLVGRNASETLSLMTLSDEFAAQLRAPDADGPDVASWEEPSSGRAIPDELFAPCRGILDHLSLQPRRILLLPELDSDGAPVFERGLPVISRCINRAGRMSKKDSVPKPKKRPAKKKRKKGDPEPELMPDDVRPSHNMNPWFAYTRTDGGSLIPVGKTDRPGEPTWYTAVRMFGADYRPFPLVQVAKYGYPLGDVIRLRLSGIHTPNKSYVDFMYVDEVSLPSTLLDRRLARNIAEALRSSEWGLRCRLRRVGAVVYGDNRQDAIGVDEAADQFWEKARKLMLQAALAGVADESWRRVVGSLAARVFNAHLETAGIPADLYVQIYKAQGER